MPIFKVPTPHGRKYGKKWVKTLANVDTSKKDGYAFAGAFLQVGELAECPVGTWLLAYGRDVASTGKAHEAEIWLMRVAEDGPETIATWTIPSSQAQSWALACRDDIAKILREAEAAEAPENTEPDFAHLYRCIAKEFQERLAHLEVKILKAEAPDAAELAVYRELRDTYAKGLQRYEEEGRQAEEGGAADS